MSGDNKLNIGEGELKRIQNFLLPRGVKVELYFINQNDTVSFRRRFFAKVSIQLGATEGDIGNQNDSLPSV